MRAHRRLVAKGLIAVGAAVWFDTLVLIDMTIQVIFIIHKLPTKRTLETSCFRMLDFHVLLKADGFSKTGGAFFTFVTIDGSLVDLLKVELNAFLISGSEETSRAAE